MLCNYTRYHSDYNSCKYTRNYKNWQIENYSFTSHNKYRCYYLPYIMHNTSAHAHTYA